MRKLWFLLLALAAPAQAGLPARLEIAYELLRNGSLVAEVTGRFEHGNGSYQLVETWKGRGMYALLGRATRTSQGSLGADGPRPREFADERSGRATARAWFDWSAKTLTMRYKGAARTEPIPPNAQDRLSFILALSASPAGRKSIDLHVVDGRGVSRHLYEFNGRERLKTAAGEFDTLKVVRARDHERAEFWLAAELGHLPVRILVVEKNGTRYDQLATRVAVKPGI